MRTGYRQLSSLSIPRSGSSLEFETGQKTLPDDMGLAQGLKWLLEGGTERQRLTIPRDLVAAVQVCPWQFVMSSTKGRSTTWAVQGLLVLANAQQCESQRLPLLVTGDCAGGSQLMRRLADVLQVPFLFHADAAGWQAESVRASSRPPLRSGGMMG
jgi:hypothetical protein